MKDEAVANGKALRCPCCHYQMRTGARVKSWRQRKLKKDPRKRIA